MLMDLESKETGLQTELEFEKRGEILQVAIAPYADSKDWWSYNARDFCETRIKTMIQVTTQPLTTC